MKVTFRRIVSLCGLVVLPGCFLVCQQTSTALQSSVQRRSSGSGLVVTFGPAASNAEGKAAACKLLQALGGSAQVNAVKSLHSTLSALRQGQQIEVDQRILYPDKQAQKMTMSQGKTLLVVTPSDAFVVVGTQVQDMPPALRASLDEALKHDPINVLQHIDDPKYIFTATGQEKVDGVEATVVDIDAGGVPTRWWIGADGKLLRERSTGEGGRVQTMVYSEWKNFAGLQYPTKYEVFSQGGQSVLIMTLTAMQVNPAVNPKLFQRPAGNR